MIYREITKEWEEVERTINEFNKKGNNIKWNTMLVDLTQSDEIVLDDVIWSRMENSDSTKMNKWDWSTLKRVIGEKTDITLLFFKILLGLPVEKPLVWKYKPQKYYLISGNTRLCIHKFLGKRPKVLLSKNKHTKIEDVNGSLVS